MDAAKFAEFEVGFAQFISDIRTDVNLVVEIAQMAEAASRGVVLLPAGLRERRLEERAARRAAKRAGAQDASQDAAR